MNLQKAYFAGGCFWCMVQPFDTHDGIEQVVSGYMGGHVENPTYQEIKRGHTGHMETVKIIYDADRFSYEKLLSIFFSVIDPTDAEGQYQDRGAQYRTAIFYTDEHKQQLAEQFLQDMAHTIDSDKAIATKLLPASKFYEADESHQMFYKKNPERYAQQHVEREAYKQAHKND